MVVTALLGVGSRCSLARLIADPLTSLGVLAEQVSKGDLTADIRSQSRDEIGWLEHSMRQMVKNLRDDRGPDRRLLPHRRHPRGGDLGQLHPDGASGAETQ